jgi:hypothetical protein
MCNLASYGRNNVDIQKKMALFFWAHSTYHVLHINILFEDKYK